MPPYYVYGVVSQGAQAPPCPGIEGATLQLISADGVAALVSEVPAEVRLGRQAMSDHARVLERALENGPVLPMRFGVVMADDQAVRADLLDGHRTALGSQLEEFADKVELKLRATYDEARLMREIVAEDQDVARLRESLRGTSEDASYYGRIRLGELVAEALQRKRQVDSRAIVDSLAPLAIAVDVAEPNHERLVLNASFLVARDQVDAFDRAVDEIGRQLQDRMRFKYTGPLPPHSFVRLEAEA